jgi:DNA modification methylase
MRKRHMARKKPVECMRRPMTNNTAPGEAVYEPFLGSGTTLIAAQSIGRTCFGVELNPAYVDVVVRRWQAFTGRSARLEVERRPTFAQVTVQRAGAQIAEAEESAPVEHTCGEA